MQDISTSSGRMPAAPLRGLTAGLPLAAVLMAALVAFAENRAVLAAVSLLACAFVLLDFRFGVACLIILMPLSAGSLFPHSLAGITGLNPVNLLLLGTSAALLAHGLPDGGIARLAPRPVVWLYLVPVIAAGLLGLRHAGDIPTDFTLYKLISFDGPAGYLRDVVLKPVLLVLFALLVGAGVARSRRPEAFLLPMLVSVWIVSLLSIACVLGTPAEPDAATPGFLAPLGLHADDLARCCIPAFALMLFTAAATPDARLKFALLATMGLAAIALILAFSRGAFVDVPGGGRLEEIWMALLPEFWKSPLWGNGLDSTLWSEAMRGGRIPLVGHPHNAYLATLIDMGAAGLLLMAAYYAHVWTGFRRLRAAAALSPTLRGFFGGAAVGLAAFLLASLAGGSLTPAPEQIYLWFAIGMMYGLRGSAPSGGVRC